MPSKTPAHKALVEKIRKARNTGRAAHLVYAFLADEEDPTRSIPITIGVSIRADGTWAVISGRELTSGKNINTRVLRGDRVWWGPWGRHYAAALLEVHREAQAAKDELAPARAWILDEPDGDKAIRVLRTFPGPRGYGE